MERRSLAGTGLLVTPIGLGLAALGRPGYVNLGRERDLGSARGVGELERRTHEVLDAARVAGIGYLDVARSYGRAEEFVAAWLASRGVGTAEVTVGTKWGYTYTADWRVDAEVHEVKDHGLATLRRQWSETGAILSRRVSLLQVHSATLDSGLLEDAAVHDELSRMRAEDEVAALGISLSGSDQAETLRRAMELAPSGRRLFDVVQATWNALEPSAGAALDEASRAGMGVIVKEALANGRLVGGAEAAPIAGIARRLGAGPDAIALAWALSQPWADVVLSGAVSVEQLRSNLAALAVDLDDEATEDLRGMARPPQTYWRERRAMRWN